MRLYPGKVSAIAQDMVQLLTSNGDIEVEADLANEVVLDIESVLREYIRADRQIIEALFHSRHVDEVYAEDHALRKTLREILNRHTHVDDDLDKEVRKRIQNLQEGTGTWEIEYQKVMGDLKRLKGLDS